MRRLIVMRHAKSSWDTETAGESLPDHARPLTERGRRDAVLVGDALAALGWAPDQVVTSDAARTLETWERMAPCFPATPFLASPRLYGAGPDGFVAVMGAVKPDRRAVLVLGHNPGWEQVVAWLCGTITPMGTADAALLWCETDLGWAQVLASGGFHLETVVRPRTLRS